MENTHEHHGLASMIVVGVSFAQDIHDRQITLVGLSFNPSKKTSRQPSPSGEALLAYRFYLLSIEAISVCLFDSLFEDVPVFEERVPKDDFLNHRKICRIDSVYMQNILTEEDIRGHF